jgi:hypothetical protein
MVLPEREPLKPGPFSRIDGLIRSVQGRLAALRMAIVAGDEKTIRDQFDALKVDFANLTEVGNQIGR